MGIGASISLPVTMTKLAGQAMTADVPLGAGGATLTDPLTVGTFLTAFLGDATTKLVPAEIAGVMDINVLVFEMKWGDDHRLKHLDVAFAVPGSEFTVADFGTESDGYLVGTCVGKWA